MLLAGLTKVRNEAEIIKDCLDHYAEFCNAGIFVYDDCSTDDTVAICEAHPAVKKVIKGITWDTNRFRAEYATRDTVLKEAQKYVSDWFIYFDADERIEIDFTNIDWDKWEGIKMRLFDYYITPLDMEKKYTEREWLGKEYRNILMMFRNYRWSGYHAIDQRESSVRSGASILYKGYVKHYGKAISIKRWEEKCKYYMKFGNQYLPKWKARQGKGIHTKSDFDTDLITWDQKDELGLPLIRGKVGEKQEFLMCKECGKNNLFYKINGRLIAFCTNTDCVKCGKDVWYPDTPIK